VLREVVAAAPGDNVHCLEGPDLLPGWRGLINDLVNLAVGERDHATNIFLQWFVTEQVEEEASADEVLQRLKLIGDASGGLFMLDREMGQRVFTPPAATEET
jgi:ferritin